MFIKRMKRKSIYKSRRATVFVEEERNSIKKIEMKVLHLRLQGYSYQEISSSLNISNRQVEYILRKLRNKKNN